MKIVSLQWCGDWEEAGSNLESLQAQLSEIMSQSDHHIDLVVLPELFHTGFSMHPERFAMSADALLNRLAQLAGLFRIYMIAGVADTEREDEKTLFRNSAWVFNPAGQRSAHYIKQKPFSYSNEQSIYASGNQSCLFDINEVSCSLFICYDLRFPELFRKVAKQASILFVIANWPEARQSHWETLLKARAIENQCFIVGVNRVGKDGNDLTYVGGSMVISPLGDVLSYGRETDKVIVTEIDTLQVKQVREKFPFLDDMQEESG